MKVIICGPPHSGKSCLRYGLKEAIKAVIGAPYPYFITACPDGEGAWFHETASADSHLAARLKADYKRKFTEEWVMRVAHSVENCVQPLTLIDIGGIPDEKNEVICAAATHAVLVAGEIERLSEWREFCGRLKLEIIAEIHSDYTGMEDKGMVCGDDGIYRGSVHRLERGDLSIRFRPAVVGLANIIVRMVDTERV